MSMSAALIDNLIGAAAAGISAFAGAFAAGDTGRATALGVAAALTDEGVTEGTTAELPPTFGGTTSRAASPAAARAGTASQRLPARRRTGASDTASTSGSGLQAILSGFLSVLPPRVY